MNDLLIEIGCEDLPARFVAPLAEALSAGVIGGLDRHGVTHGDGRSFATPRRIAALVQSVAEMRAEQRIERKGPKLTAALKDGQPTPAGLGFAKSCGVEFTALAQEDGQLVFRQTAPGRATIELIGGIFEDTLKRMDELVPKRMRWGVGEETFVRPVQWVLALLGTEIVSLTRFGVTAGRLTYGHRFHAPDAITLAAPRYYESMLRDAKVWADFATRRTDIQRQIALEAAKIGGTPRVTEELLDEVTALVEWPVVISGRIEERFLQLPPEVIVATVETNQRYFTVFSKVPTVPEQMKSENGYLEPAFITITNIESKDVAQVIAGNERVVRPRLTDALFFWEQDRKVTLESFWEKIKETTYQKDLGSMAAKRSRVDGLARLAIVQLQNVAALGIEKVSELQISNIYKVVDLAKCDLASRIVGEFPELQGLTGGYYAQIEGQREGVSIAIAEHYRPVQAGGPIPSTIEGRIVALADKLDTVAGIFKIGQKPTASKDPYAVRRAALGALRIVIEGELDLDLYALVKSAWDAQPVQPAKGTSPEDVWSFIIERFRSYCADRSAIAEQFEAVLNLDITHPLDLIRRLDALKAFAATEAAASLAAADKRARNILRQAGEGAAAATISAELFDQPAEHGLLAQIDLVDMALKPLREKHAYDEMLMQLATLKDAVDLFFNSVMVMAEDPAVRANRLALLARLDGLCREVADLSCLPG